MKITQKLVVAG